MKFIRYTTKGFTLLETLASITVLSLVVIGPLSVTISSSGYARQTKDTIVANYLAEEAVELLQNQYDSMYVYCKKNVAATQPGGLCESATEETSQTAWRLFKNKLSSTEGQALSNSQPSCYLPKAAGPAYTGDTGNANGCALDYVGMIASSDEVLTRYDASSNNCKYLVPASTSTSRYVQIDSAGQAGAVNGWVNSTSTSYVCNGVPAHIPRGAKIQPKEYIRSVTVEQLPTFEGAVSADQQYSDDLRITSSVKFKALNGAYHTVTVTRFMHARP